MNDDDALAGLPATELSRVIGLIYDCAVDVERWPAAIAAMCGLIGSHHGGITVIDPRRRQFKFASIWSGNPEWPRWAKLLHETYGAEMPFFEAYMQHEVGETMNTEMLQNKLGRHDFYQSRFYTEWAAPQGLRDHVGAVIVKAPDSFCVVTLHTHDHQELVGPRELAIGRLLIPHVRRAVLVGDLLEMRRLEAETIKSTLDLLTSAVVLLDDTARLVHANTAAQAMLATGDPIAVELGKLCFRDAAANAALRTAIAKTAQEDAALGRSGIGIPVPFLDGRPAIAHVLPISRPPVRNGLASAATAAIFIGTAQVLPPPADSIAALYDLTPTEQKVLASILDGRNRSETARHLGIAGSTAKTHLDRIFSKTGLASQSELMRLAERLTSRAAS